MDFDFAFSFLILKSGWNPQLPYIQLLKKATHSKLLYISRKSPTNPYYLHFKKIFTSFF